MTTYKDRTALKELEAQVKQMTKEWGLLDNSTFADQMRVVEEEKTEAMTEIGDVMFSSISAKNCAKKHDDLATAHHEYNKAVSCAMALGASPVECLRMAITKNNGRVGMIVEETGKFTKWKNLTHAQRIEITKSGKLNRDGVDVNSLLDCCSDNERREILEIINTPNTAPK